MVKATSRSNTAQGPAVGVTGVGLGGALRAVAVTSGQFVGTVSVRLRTRGLDASIQPGSVGVEVALVLGGLVAGAAPVAADALDSRPAEWAKFGHVWTGQGCVWHPNVFVNPGEKGQILVRVWNRDDLDSARIVVDVSVTCSEEPVPGSDTPDPTFAPGTGTLRSITGANPAAGAEASVLVPVGLRWRASGFYVTRVNDANAADRNMHIAVKASAGGAVMVSTPPASFTTASATCLYTWAPDTILYAMSNVKYGASAFGSATYLAGGRALETVSLNGQVGDDMNAPVALIEEWVLPGIAS